jgi:DNA-binding transcriptional ArsR family regulator
MTVLAPTTTDILRLLACPVRLRMLCAVAEEPTTIGGLARLVGVHPSTAAHHVQRLAWHDLVTVEPDTNRRWVQAAVHEIRIPLRRATP